MASFADLLNVFVSGAAGLGIAMVALVIIAALAVLAIGALSAILSAVFIFRKNKMLGAVFTALIILSVYFAFNGDVLLLAVLLLFSAFYCVYKVVKWIVRKIKGRHPSKHK